VPAIPIAAIDDPRLRDYRNVPDADLLQRDGLFVAEGRLVVERLLTHPTLTTRSVLVTETAFRALGGVLAHRAEVPVFVAPPALVQGITGFNIHRGCLAIGERPRMEPWPHVVQHARRLVILERVANADNMGAVFRNAAALGGDAVLLGPSCVDPLYRKAIRTSMGAALIVPYAHAVSWPGDLAGLRARGFGLVGLTPSGGRTLRDVAAALPRDPLVAILLGHEGEGLSVEALDACDHRAAIPMTLGVDSLNVATAAAIALYEINGRRP
jgi:tRNA G18 (ribose-2'-O)-methylase SpoU